jgi:hypothetical protein
MYCRGYVALFHREITAEHLRACVGHWLEHFDRVEQVCPGEQSGNVTLELQEPGDMVKTRHGQFRVSRGDCFTWVYAELDRRVMETSSLPEEGNTLAVEVLNLPGVQEVVDQGDEATLECWERQGWM